MEDSRVERQDNHFHFQENGIRNRRKKPVVEEVKQYSDSEDDDEEEEDLEGYLEDLMHTLGLSTRARKVMGKEFRKSSMAEKFATISSLESQVRDERSKPEPARRLPKVEGTKLQHTAPTYYRPETNDDDNGEEDEEQKEILRNEVSDRLDAMFSYENCVDDDSAVDEAWEELICKSLPNEKGDLLRNSYCSEKSPEKRFHMYLEFSSYLRPLSEAGQKYQEMIHEEDNGTEKQRQPGGDADVPRAFGTSALFGSWVPENIQTFAVIFVATFFIRLFLVW